MEPYWKVNLPLQSSTYTNIIKCHHVKKLKTFSSCMCSHIKQAFSNICVVSSEFAAACLDTLRRSLAFGGRRNIPSRPEVGLLLASWRVRSNLSKWTLKFSVPNCWPRLLQTDQNSQPLPVELPGGAVLSFPIDTFSVKKTHPVTFTL